MEVKKSTLLDALLIQPKKFGDHRGFFVETYQEQRYLEAGLTQRFVQDNLSSSTYGVLRGLHYQHTYPQGKLVSVVKGEVFDVAVDIRKGSPTFGKWEGAILTENNMNQFWIPPGFAHGFVVLSEMAIFAYKCTDIYHPETEIAIRWDDPEIGIKWPISPFELKISPKDEMGVKLKDVSEKFLTPFHLEM
ncbi:MAG: dTDP-4-dehydrorhamnose 3,5-epimerase [Proteobacteria bacterium]|nr:MAG: dTDP-4-dehydrorhamnose 3,5-epimerase [Pseudomonadota bacterium]